MNTTMRYKELVDDSYRLSSPLLLDTALQQISKEKDSLRSALSESGDVKVPIVGDFSAGKSSLLNAFMGNGELLPVDITPETAVAYELYYGIDEHVELFREGNKIEERSLREIKQLSTRPGDIVKVYIKSEKIKELELRGITLVDMPGIDSGIKEHNDAILNYINKGTAFVLLVDCAGGSLRQSTLAFIGELSKYNLKPAVILSKCDKKPASQLEEIVEYVSFQARKAIGSETYVGKISAHDNDIAGFTDYLAKLNVQQLIASKFAGRVEGFISQQISALKSQASIYSSDIANVEEQVKVLATHRIDAENAINNANVGDTPEKSTQDVLDLVHASLLSHTIEIAQMTIDKEDASEINARILNYIRPVIVSAFREEGEQYASAMNTVVDNVSTALQNNLTIDGNIFDNLVEGFREEIIGGVAVAADLLMALPSVFAQVLGWVLQLLGEKVPDVIKWILGKSDEDALLEVEDKMRETIIPQIIERLRPNILEQITAQQQRIRENVSSNVASAIGNLQDSVMASGENSDKEALKFKVLEIERCVEKLEKIKVSI
ncbi:MAG: dynamin family protein [Muribaculaceae bacterium]|nr:dynamin family protein [Muribaculaceae bacterium]